MAFGKDKKNGRNFNAVVIVKATKDVPRKVGKGAPEEVKKSISPLLKKGQKARMKLKDAYPLFEKGMVEMIDPKTKDDLTKEAITEEKKKVNKQ